MMIIEHFTDAVKGTLHADAILSPDELTLGDWVDEIEARLKDTVESEGSLPIPVFNACVAVTTLVVYATYDDERGVGYVDTAAPAYETFMDYLGLGRDHTVRDLLDALEAETLV